MTAGEIHIGDVNTAFIATIKDDDEVAVPVDGASSKIIYFKKPSGVLLTKNAVLNTDGLDGKIKYSSIAGDLDEHGNWRMQGKVVFPTGTWYSDIYDFVVHENLA